MQFKDVLNDNEVMTKKQGTKLNVYSKMYSLKMHLVEKDEIFKIGRLNFQYKKLITSQLQRKQKQIIESQNP